MIRLGKSVPVGRRPRAGETVVERILGEVFRSAGWPTRRFERVSATSLRHDMGRRPERRWIGGKAGRIHERIGIQRTAAVPAIGHSTGTLAGPARGRPSTAWLDGGRIIGHCYRYELIAQSDRIALVQGHRGVALGWRVVDEQPVGAAVGECEASIRERDQAVRSAYGSFPQNPVIVRTTAN